MHSTRLATASLLLLSLAGSMVMHPVLAVPPQPASKYVRQEPISDPGREAVKPSAQPEKKERTRLRRPGDGDAAPASAPAPAPDRSSQAKEPPPQPAPMPLYGRQSSPPVPREKWPSVGQLEQLMFGHASPGIAVEQRLEKLEQSVFQRSYFELDTEQRIRRLKEVLVGSPDAYLVPRTVNAPAHPGAVPIQPPGTHVPQASFPNQPYQAAPRTAPPGQLPYQIGPAPSVTGILPSQPPMLQGQPGLPAPSYQSDYRPRSPSQPETSAAPFFENIQRFDLSTPESLPELEKFALVVTNESRARQGLQPLQWSDLAHQVAIEHVRDLSNRTVISHHSSAGENPDLRYTKAGGSDVMEECLIMFPSAEHLRPTRELVVKMLEALNTRQDDHDALHSRHATDLGMSFNWSKDRKRLICCVEVVTKHADVEPLPVSPQVGEKIEVKGVVNSPYRFHKITLAWEGETPALEDDGEEAVEALPYFPPLDYEAHAAKSEKDWDKGVRFLQIAGITAAIAGGFFMPPVALAAPLIAATATAPSVKAVSDIPIKGGVKTDGSSFSHRLPLNNDGKEGIYYITVWARPDDKDELVPVSRRAIIARKFNPQDVQEPAAPAAIGGDDLKTEKSKKNNVLESSQDLSIGRAEREPACQRQEGGGAGESREPPSAERATAKDDGLGDPGPTPGPGGPKQGNDDEL